MIKTIISGLFSILILASISSIAYTEFVSPLQYSYAAPFTMPPLPLPDLVLNGSPTVGETGEIVMTFVYDPSRWAIEDPMIEMSIGGNGDELYTITDITSNVHTGNPDVFEPYDYLTQSQLAIPDYPYVVKGTVKILNEGFHDFIGVGLGNTFDVGITLAINDSRHMSYSTYIAEGHTFLDHTRQAIGTSDDTTSQLPPPPLSAPKAAPAGLTHRETIAELENYIASAYLEEEHFSHKALLDELQNIHLTVPQIKEFLKNKTSISDGDISNLVAMIPADYGISGIATGQTSHFASFDATGRVAAPSYLFQSDVTNIYGIEVCALDYDTLRGGFAELRNNEDEIACGYTSPLGVYNIQNIINNDPNDNLTSNTNVDLVIRVTSRGQSSLIVQNVTSQPYVQYSTRVDNFTATNTITNLQLTNGAAGAGRIIDTISDGRAFFDDYRISPQQITVNWQHDAGASIFAGISDNGARIFLNSDTIFFDGAIDNDSTTDDSFERHVILHEFGHHVMDIAGVFVGDCRISPHFIESVSDAQCAWTEGWADFVPHLVDNSAMLPLVAANTGSTIINVYVDLEEERFIYSVLVVEPIAFDRQNDNNMNVGHLVEGQVAAALWDIKDTPINSVYDRAGVLLDGALLDDQALGDDAIMDVFYNSLGYRVFEEFYDAWTSQKNPPIRNIMLLHAMAFAVNTDPIVLTDVSGTRTITLNPTSGQEYPSSVPLPINEENLKTIIGANVNSVSDADLSDIVIDNIVQTNLGNPNGLHDIGSERRFGLGDVIAYNITDPNYRQADTYSFRVTLENTGNNRTGTGNMIIMLGEPLTCEAQIITDAINFGELANGEASNNSSFITINNTGSQTVLPGITAKHWVSSAAPDVIVMDAQQTRWTLNSSASYNNKTPLSFNVTQDTGMSLASSVTQNVYLQLLVDLIDDAHEGQVSQDLTVTSTCK